MIKLSVIFSTYNSPTWLEKVLWGYSQQTHSDFEIIIADDGSTNETRLLIDKLRAETGLNIKYVWQEDKGFRKCRILNKAILHAESDYLVFTDGDCIPRQDFLAVHAQEARQGCFLAGSYIRLPMSLSRLISKQDILSGRCFELNWLKHNGLPSSKKNLKISAGPILSTMLHFLTTSRANFKGGNSSAWLKDIIKINGFDERMAWGGEDREFGVRLLNAGIKARHVRYNTLTIHLDHSRNYADLELAARNKDLRKKNQKFRIATTEHGINQLIEQGYTTNTSAPKRVQL